MSKELNQKVDKLLIELLDVKENMATKKDIKKFDKRMDEVLANTDGLAKKVENTQDEQTANISAHDRFEKRITNLESSQVAV